jgi:hypothetical protein
LRDGAWGLGTLQQSLITNHSSLIASRLAARDSPLARLVMSDERSAISD